MEISKEAFLEWQNHPVTQAFRELLHREMQGRKDDWADGKFLHDKIAEARILGAIDAAKAILDLEQEDLNHE
jgi:hypothetical protein